MTTTAPSPARHPRHPRQRGRAQRRRRRTDGSWSSGGFLGLAGVVALLAIVGLVMVLSASSVHDLRVYHSAWYSFVRQAVYVILGAVTLLVAARVDYRFWRRWSVPMLGICVFLCMAVLVPGIGVRVAGSARWLGAGPVQFQPSEVLKFALAVFCADVLSRRAHAMREGHYAYTPVVLAFLGTALLIMLQPDMGTTLVLGCIVVAVMFAGGVPLLTMGSMLLLSAFGAFLLGIVEPYRRARMMAFLHPLADKSNTGYQSVQGLVALGSGGLFGVGLGASRAKWGFLPNAHTDFIFAIIGNELGLLGALLVVGLFVAFAVLGVRAAVRAPDRFGALLAAAITAWIVGQAVLNIGAVIGLFPVTGVPLPFVSYGGTSLIIAMGGVGVLLNVARQGRPVRGGREWMREPVGKRER